jgi:hypothetical protein
MTWRYSRAAAALLLLVTGCGGSAHREAPAAAAGSGGAGGDAGSAGHGAQGGARAPETGNACSYPCESVPAAEREKPLPPPVCPDLEPGDGEACDPDRLICSYGDSPTPLCRRYYHCDAGRWALDRALECQKLPDDYCPAAPAQGKACVVEVPGLPCSFDDDVSCVCVGSLAARGQPGSWHCYGPPSNKACPATLPNIGEGCATNGVQCNYAADGCSAPPNSTVYCFEGAWEEAERLSCSL